MKKIILKNKRLAWILSFFLLISSCGGGSSSSSSNDDNNNNDGEVTVQALQSLNNIPDIDMDALDAATGGASASQVAGLAALSAVENSSTEFSMAGCSARNMVGQFKNNLLQFQGNLCIMKAMEANTGLEVGNGSYNYYNMSLPLDEQFGGTNNIRIKIGLVDNVLRLALCEEREDSYEQAMALTFQVTNGKFDGQITDSHQSPFDSSQYDMMRITALLESENPEDFEDGDTAQFTAQFDGLNAGSMALEVGKDGETLYNIVNAAYRSGNDQIATSIGNFIDQVYAKYNAEQGCSAFHSEGAYPGMNIGIILNDDTQSELASAGFQEGDSFCWKSPQDLTGEENSLADFIAPANDDGLCPYEHGVGTNNDNPNEGIECYTFSLEEELLDYFVYDTDQATYFDEVSAQATSLSEFSPPSLSFDDDETWDCTAPDAFVEIEINNNTDLATAITTCTEIFSQIMGGQEMDSCIMSVQESTVEDTTGTPIDDGRGDDASSDDDQDDSDNDSDSNNDSDDSDGPESCVTDDDCPDGLVCNPDNNICSITCTVDAECTAMDPDLICSEGFCLPADAESDSDSEGDDNQGSCTVDADCSEIPLSGVLVCGPSNICTVMCATENDCNGIESLTEASYSCDMGESICIRD